MLAAGLDKGHHHPCAYRGAQRPWRRWCPPPGSLSPRPCAQPCDCSHGCSAVIAATDVGVCYHTQLVARTIRDRRELAAVRRDETATTCFYEPQRSRPLREDSGDGPCTLAPTSPSPPRRAPPGPPRCSVAPHRVREAQTATMQPLTPMARLWHMSLLLLLLSAAAWADYFPFKGDRPLRRPPLFTCGGVDRPSVLLPSPQHLSSQLLSSPS